MARTKPVLLMERKLKLREAPKTDLEAVIRAFVHDDIKLTPEQQKLSERLLFVDEHIRARKLSHTDIIQLTMKKYDVTRYRAERDIVDAMKLFGESRKLNKAYLMSHHIVEIQRQIQMCLDEKVMELVPKLNDNLIYALNSLPVETDHRESPPAQIIFIYNAPPPVNIEDLTDVMEQADALIKTPTNGDYLAFDEGEEGDNPAAESSPDDGSDGAGE